MCYKHQCQAWAVNNGLVNAFTKLPASQLVAAFHYHALNYIPGQIVPACMASIFDNSQCRGHWPLVNAFTIQLYLYTAYWILVWVAIFVDWLKGPFTIVRKVLQEAILSSLSAPPPFIGSLNWSQLAPQFPHYFPKYWFSPTPSATAKEVNML